MNKNAPEGVKIEYKMSGWKIFGIVVAAILGLILVIMLLVCCIRRCKKAMRKNKKYDQVKASSKFED